MSGIDSFFFKMWDPVNSVKKNIEKWTPDEKLSSEAECEKILTSHLVECYPNLLIRNQFPYDRVKADIVIEKTVAIELKYKLEDGNEFNRLLGQIDHYQDWGINLIVVIIGDILSDYAHRIKKKLSQLWEEGEFAYVNKLI